MKTLKLFLAAVLLVAVLGLLLLRLFGYEPQDQSPGLWLAGELVTAPVTDWTFTNDHEEIYVQTRTPYFIPHSITTYCAVYDGELYLFSAYYEGGEFPEARAWNRNVLRDPRVRLKIGGSLFDRTVSHVTDEALRSNVHASFVAKYPQWNSPGLENVHILLVQ